MLLSSRLFTSTDRKWCFTLQFHCLIFNYAKIISCSKPDMVHITKCTTTGSCMNESAHIYTDISGVSPCLSFLWVLCPHLSSPLLLHHSSRSNIRLSALGSPPSRRGWPQRVQPRVTLLVYRVGADTDIGSQRLRSKSCIWNLFLWSDTLHFMCIFTYSDPGSHFLSVRDRVKTGHRQTESVCFLLLFKELFFLVSATLKKKSMKKGSRKPWTQLLTLGISTDTLISW